jgi:predicted secreted protein
LLAGARHNAGAMALSASAALAGTCSDDQESQAGMLAAGVSKDVVSKVVAVTGKQMVNVESCDFGGNTFHVEYKYNFLAADGLYWIEASAKFDGAGNNASVKVTKASPNMAAAEAKAGVKLASN